MQGKNLMRDWSLSVLFFSVTALNSEINAVSIVLSYVAFFRLKPVVVLTRIVKYVSSLIS